MSKGVWRMRCPRCNKGGVRQLSKSGAREDYQCPACHLAYRISGSARRAIEKGRRADLVKDVRGRMWLRPDNWPS
jgi:transposase-like protein